MCKIAEKKKFQEAMEQALEDAGVVISVSDRRQDERMRKKGLPQVLLSTEELKDLEIAIRG